MHQQTNFNIPERLPFLEAVCWDLRDVRVHEGAVRLGSQVIARSAHTTGGLFNS